MIERSVNDGIATLRLDDGKANAFTVDVITELHDTLDACRDDRAVVLAGRDGVFSAGLDTRKVSSADPDELYELLVAFGRLLGRVWLEPRPVVAAASGHAIAGGTVLAMACDHVIAARGEFKWGLSEITVGLPMPQFALAIARGSVRPDRLDQLILGGALVGPDDAVEAGFADELAPPGEVLDVALDRARRLAGPPRETYAATKRRLRGAAADVTLAGLDADVRELLIERAAAPAAP